METLMKINVRQWGNSIGIRLPQNLAKEIGIVEGSEIEIDVVDKKLVISKPKMSLNGLLSMITKENTHPEIKTGKIKGKEVW